MQRNARCHALDSHLNTCGIPFAEHGNIKHDFQVKPVRKHHIPWTLLGEDHSYCGRRPIHFNDPTAMVWVPNEKAAAVRTVARMNSICTACFKNWVYLENRASFIGRRNTW